MLKTACLTVLLLLVPFAAAQPNVPPAPDLPGFKECSEFQVDWYHCDGYLVCLRVWWLSQGVDESACVPNEIQCDLDCSFCAADTCPLPEAQVCSDRFREPLHCAALLCAHAEWDPYFTTQPVCVQDPCPGLDCLVCPGSCGLVEECSEFQIDWQHCEGRIVCVWADDWIYLEPVCVADPCAPNLSGCVSCDVNVCYHRCDFSASGSYGTAGCDGFNPVDYYCLSCPSVVRLTCYVDTNGDFQCWIGRA